MDVALYTGNGGTQSITGLAFSPDFVWTKVRNIGYGHRVWDTVRGATKRLETHDTTAEVTESNALTAFNSDGFSVGDEANVNQSSRPYVAWCWDAGTTTASNTAGSITSQVRANVSAGFSIVTWTTTSSAGTVGHGLNITPSIVLFKRRDSAQDWYFETNIIDGSYDYLVLNSTAAKVDGGSSWSTRATSTTITSFTGTAGLTYVAYCFAPVVGYSSFGSYVGNGSSDGPMVYTGFRPRWLLVKSVNYADTWVLIDAARETYNVMNTQLRPNSSNAESVAVNDAFDFLSNGFKIRGGGAVINTSSAPFVYACFAENPFQYARAR